ncbi:MAG TPA: hypothetical protein PK759_01755, partial [Spirochaetales bacterium]|nr:hypothetical protein [Spirochaetales bacterium]
IITPQSRLRQGKNLSTPRCAALAHMSGRGARADAEHERTRSMSGRARSMSGRARSMSGRSTGGNSTNLDRLA